MPQQPPRVRVERLPFRATGQFAARDVAYAEGDERLAPFRAYAPTLADFDDALAARAGHPVDRETLVAVIRDQYAAYGLEPPPGAGALIEPTTYTVTTAHQASLFLGPLYYVYKILSAVRLARDLNARWGERARVVPVFVLGDEDHDLDEIDHVRVRGEVVTWRTEQTGATGQMTLAGIEPALARVEALLGPGTSAREIVDLLRACYRPERTLGEATAHFVAALFGPLGVAVVRLGDPRLKANFAASLRREALEHLSKPLVEAAVAELEAAGFAQQAHARDVNLFYLRPGRRDRLVALGGGGVGVHGTDIAWSRDEAEVEIAAHPERFSPNVVTRPLYQEATLPNLAYVGGGGELAYWLERRSQFAAFGIPYPVLVRRDSAWWIGRRAARMLGRLGLGYRDLLGDEHELARRFVAAEAEVSVDLSAEAARVRAVFEELSRRALAVDPSLEMRALAHGTRAAQAVEDLERRFVRALKRRSEVALDRIDRLRAELLPGGGLQERSTSFLDLYATHGPTLFDVLLEAFDPLDMRLKVFLESADGDGAEGREVVADDG